MTTDLKNIRRDAIRLLSRRDHSQQELLRKLAIKGHASTDVQTLLPELVQKGYLNEGRFVENYIYYRRNKGYGPERISLELKSRGITDEMIAEHLNITDNAWFTQAHTVWLKQFKGQTPSDFKAKAKQMRFLQYRGFTQLQIESLFE